MKISLCFRQLQIGVLERTSDGYSYTSNRANEQEIRELLGTFEYKLWDSKNRLSKILFPEFERILKSCSREDIVKRARLNTDDTKWNKLVKLSRLNWLTPNLYVQTVDYSGEKDN
jgi:hypothetical protein